MWNTKNDENTTRPWRKPWTPAQKYFIWSDDHAMRFWLPLGTANEHFNPESSFPKSWSFQSCLFFVFQIFSFLLCQKEQQWITTLDKLHGMTSMINSQLLFFFNFRLLHYHSLGILFNLHYLRFILNSTSLLHPLPNPSQPSARR